VRDQPVEPAERAFRSLAQAEGSVASSNWSRFFVPRKKLFRHKFYFKNFPAKLQLRAFSILEITKYAPMYYSP
jgi:hypothetical protein